MPAIARQLSTSDHTDPRRWGRRKPSMRTKLLTVKKLTSVSEVVESALDSCYFVSTISPGSSRGETRMKRSMVAILAALLLLPATSHAAFPGANGKIAFVRGDDIWTMNSDGTAQVNLTNNASHRVEPGLVARRQADRIRPADPRPGVPASAVVMNADGTGAYTRADSVRRRCQDPAWSPTGTQLVYIDFGAGSVVRIKLDGTGRRTCPRGDEPFDPEWSPDGSSDRVQRRRSGRSTRTASRTPMSWTRPTAAMATT